MARLAQVLLSMIGPVVIILGLLILAYEGLAFLTGLPTESDIVRSWIKANPFFAMVSVLLLGALLGHFFAI